MAELRFPLHGLSRLRMATDGAGITTLVAAQGCPLRCRFCLNPQSVEPGRSVPMLTPQALYERVRVDDLYFQATGGGVTFGGGEPLLHAAFIRAFRELCGDRWKLRAETSLHVPRSCVRIAAECLDEFIVDIKDTDPDIYRAYTGQENNIVMENLRLLLALVGTERVIVRVPDIPGYNDEKATLLSIRRLQEIGIARIDRFQYRTEKRE